jgi:phospholipid/cholesterol/gamma-HCH transport system permease protein
MSVEGERGRDEQRHAPGLYEGLSPRVVGVVPERPRSTVAEIGGMIELLGQIIWSALKKPYGFWAESLDYFFVTLRRSALPMAAAIFGFLLFFSLVVVIFFSQAGAVSLGTAYLFQYGFRAFTVFVVAVVVSGVAGAALTTDLGARKIREELDAMTVMGIDPIRELVVPRAISLTVLTTLISLPGLAVTAVGLQLGASYYGHLSAADFYHSLFSSLSPLELYSVLINCFMLGVLITTVCCYKGLNAGGGSIGLGRAVNQAVVVSYVALFVFQLAYNAIFLGLFPELGRVR